MVQTQRPWSTGHRCLRESGHVSDGCFLDGNFQV